MLPFFLKKASPRETFRHAYRAKRMEQRIQDALLTALWPFKKADPELCVALDARILLCVSQQIATVYGAKYLQAATYAQVMKRADGTVPAPTRR